MSPLRKILVVLLLSCAAPAMTHMTGTPTHAPGQDLLIGRFVEDGEYRASYEVMDLHPPVTWLTDWMFA